MKKIINGKMYNTETADWIANYWNQRSSTDFRHVDENLYRKKTGEFFLQGEGGPLTSYARACGNAYCSGENIRPLTEDEAREWLEEYGTADEYIRCFGEPEE